MISQASSLSHTNQPAGGIGSTRVRLRQRVGHERAGKAGLDAADLHDGVLLPLVQAGHHAVLPGRGKLDAAEDLAGVLVSPCCSSSGASVTICRVPGCYVASGPARVQPHHQPKCGRESTKVSAVFASRCCGYRKPPSAPMRCQRLHDRESRTEVTVRAVSSPGVRPGRRFFVRVDARLVMFRVGIGF